MNVYLLSQAVNDGYDTYDSAVVIAKSEDDARLMYPGYTRAIDWTKDDMDLRSWAKPDQLTVELIGTTYIEEPRVVCASFNAG